MHSSMEQFATVHLDMGDGSSRAPAPLSHTVQDKGQHSTHGVEVQNAVA